MHLFWYWLIEIQFSKAPWFVLENVAFVIRECCVTLCPLLPSSLQAAHLAHPQQHPLLPALQPGWRNGGGGLPIYQAVCALQVLPIQEDEDRVAEQRISGQISDSGKQASILLPFTWTKVHVLLKYLNAEQIKQSNKYFLGK